MTIIYHNHNSHTQNPDQVQLDNFTNDLTNYRSFNEYQKVPNEKQERPLLASSVYSPRMSSGIGPTLPRPSAGPLSDAPFNSSTIFKSFR